MAYVKYAFTSISPLVWAWILAWLLIGIPILVVMT